MLQMLHVCYLCKNDWDDSIMISSGETVSILNTLTFVLTIPTNVFLLFCVSFPNGTGLSSGTDLPMFHAISKISGDFNPSIGMQCW